MRACYSNLFEQNFNPADGDAVNINRIVVPKIQRSYAQGRKGESYIRNTFLKDIFEHLVAEKDMDLNFIYGAVRKMENSMVFELIDGQQRMTTLFLLHWYIANRELEHSSEEYIDICSKLAKFTYETRVTSTDFCQMLASYRGEVTSSTPSKVLKQSKWYFKAYDKDATVECMMNMLDAIHHKYEETLSNEGEISLFKSLDKLQFQVLSLGEFGLTEELYIKMNSRGLPLSSFDNFKAELTGYLRNIPVGKDLVPLSNSYTGDKVPFAVNFSTNLDTNWINIFWSKEEPEFDAKYFKFFHIYLGYKYLLEPFDTSSDMRKDPVVKFFLAEDNYSEKYKGFSIYKAIFDAHPEYFTNISKVLTTLSSHYYPHILPNINASWEKTKKIESFFGKTTQTINIAFFATTEFIEAYQSFDVDVFKKWMRVAWNIIENSETDNFMNIAGVIRNLSRIVRYTASCKGYGFYDALALYGAGSGHSLPTAIQEEIIKASRIATDPQWEDIFISAEKHPFLKGTTSFYYSDSICQDDFKHRVEMLEEIFGEAGTKEMYKAEGHILLRALISRITSWKEIIDKHLTDKNETNKHFKHWLIRTNSIHNFFCEVLDSADSTHALEKLRLAVSLESPLTDGTEKRIHTTLYRNGKLQTWLQDHDATKLRFFKDNIYMMKPNSSVNKVMLDTNRNRFVPDIISNYYFKYMDSKQESFWNDTRYYYGNDLELIKETEEAEVRIIFTTESRYIIKVKPNGQFKKKSFLERFNLEENQINDGYITIVDNGKYNSPTAYDEITTNYLDVIQSIIDE